MIFNNYFSILLNRPLLELRPRTRVSTKVILEDGRTLHYRSFTKAEGEQLDLYVALGLSPQILGSRKIIL